MIALKASKKKSRFINQIHLMLWTTWRRLRILEVRLAKCMKPKVKNHPVSQMNVLNIS